MSIFDRLKALLWFYVRAFPAAVVSNRENRLDLERVPQFWNASGRENIAPAYPIIQTHYNFWLPRSPMSHHVQPSTRKRCEKILLTFQKSYQIKNCSQNVNRINIFYFFPWTKKCPSRTVSIKEMEPKTRPSSWFYWTRDLVLSRFGKYTFL